MLLWLLGVSWTLILHPAATMRPKALIRSHWTSGISFSPLPPPSVACSPPNSRLPRAGFNSTS